MATRSNFSKHKKSIQDGNFQDLNMPESNQVVKKTIIPNPEEWEKQILYWRSHLDCFIEEYLSTPDSPIKFFPFQKVIVRESGNCVEIIDCESRGLGKTFKVALIASALSILYPDNRILIVSKTARQAILTVKWIKQMASKNPNLSREIIHPIRISKDEATVNWKSGSTIEALAMGTDGSTLRGLRKKIIIIDESLLISNQPIDDVLSPILQYKRDIYWKYRDQGFEDFDSKLIQLSSAFVKSCDFYGRIRRLIKDINKGDTNKFVCALSYKTGVKYGIIDENYVLSQKRKMPLSSWECEWNCRFIGATEGSFFPYDLTQPCRTLESVELFQPANSTSRYILTLDVATSEAKYSDHACLCIIKMSERNDGTFLKSLVFIRSFHGYKLDMLAKEIRKMCVRFPNVEKVIIDVRNMGEGILPLLNTPYVDENKKEHPPMVPDTYIGNGKVLPIIREIKADNKMNNKMAMATKRYFEDLSLVLPIPYVNIRSEMEDSSKDFDEDKKVSKKEESKKDLMLEEVAVFIDADALQYECGNIVPKVVAGGTTYNTPSALLKKDRYSSMAMGLQYISDLEEENKENLRGNGEMCWGVTGTW
jgi:hypothetical protein